MRLKDIDESWMRNLCRTVGRLQKNPAREMGRIVGKTAAQVGQVRDQFIDDLKDLFTEIAVERGWISDEDLQDHNYTIQRALPPPRLAIATDLSPGVTNCMNKLQRGERQDMIVIDTDGNVITGKDCLAAAKRLDMPVDIITVPAKKIDEALGRRGLFRGVGGGILAPKISKYLPKSLTTNFDPFDWLKKRTTDTDILKTIEVIQKYGWEDVKNSSGVQYGDVFDASWGILDMLEADELKKLYDWLKIHIGISTFEEYAAWWYLVGSTRYNFDSTLRTIREATGVNFKILDIRDELQRKGLKYIDDIGSKFAKKILPSLGYVYSKSTIENFKKQLGELRKTLGWDEAERELQRQLGLNDRDFALYQDGYINTHQVDKKIIDSILLPDWTYWTRYPSGFEINNIRTLPKNSLQRSLEAAMPSGLDPRESQGLNELLKKYPKLFNWQKYDEWTFSEWNNDRNTLLTKYGITPFAPDQVVTTAGTQSDEEDELPTHSELSPIVGDSATDQPAQADSSPFWTAHAPKLWKYALARLSKPLLDVVAEVFKAVHAGIVDLPDEIQRDIATGNFSKETKSPTQIPLSIEYKPEQVADFVNKIQNNQTEELEPVILDKQNRVISGGPVIAAHKQMNRPIDVIVVDTEDHLKDVKESLDRIRTLSGIAHN